MRNLRFRAWDKWGKCMVKVAGLSWYWKDVEGVSEIYIDSGEYVQKITRHGVSGFELMQYTGLKDKNGTKIYEGDIIRFHHLEDLPEMAEVAEVVYFGHRDYPAFDLNYHRIKEYYFESNILSEIICSGAYHYEVIGNVFENPELLETEKGGSDGEDHIG